MRYFGWGTVAGLGMAGLLALAQPAAAEGGTSSGTTGSQGSSSSTYGSGSSSTTGSDTGTSGSSTAGTSTGSSDTSTSGTMGSGSTASTTGDTASSQHLVGTVEKFDHASKELTLANSDKKLKISDDTTVMKDGQQASLSDIQEGDQVRASFSGSGDTLQVSRIEVMSAGSTGTGSMGTTPSPSTPSDTGSPTSPGTTGSGTGTSGTDTGATGGSSTGTTGSDTGKRY